jgi:hypothetical protein
LPEAISKFEPHRTLYLRGFDRRGCAASLHSASSSGFTVSGVFSDIADFVVVVLFDADDNYGHLFTTRYLPDFNLTGVVVDFDLAITNGFYPGSSKSQSVPWGMLSWITSSGTPGTTPLNITSTTGEVAASATFTLAGTPTSGDRVQIVYLGNVVFDSNVFGAITTGETLGAIATAMAAAINAATSSVIPLTASSSGAMITITCTQPGQDGNTIELLSMYNSAGNTTISPALAKLTGGVDPTSFHVTLDFSAMGLASLRQCWLTLAPSLPIDSGGVNPTLVPFTAKEFSYVFSSWTLTDPDSNTPLSVAGPGSVVVSSRDWWTSFSGSGWAQQVGAYFEGFARASAHSGDSVTIEYSCQSMHSLYLGTVLGAGFGTFDVTLDSVSQTPLDCALSSGGPLPARRLLASSVAAGTHTVVLTLSSSATCYFDFLQAAVLSDVQDPAVTYSTVNAAADFDTNQTYQIAPERLLWIQQRMGFTGDLDFYAGVFFALKRIRNGGSFHHATVTLSGTFNSGDVVWVTAGGTFPNSGTTISGATTKGGNPSGIGIGGTVFGVQVYPADTLTTLAQRIVDAINGLFVGVCAAPTATAGQLTVTVLSPINGFTFDVSLATGAAGSLAVAGDIGVMVAGAPVGGQEGVWGVDATQTSPLNRAFKDYLTDMATLMQAAAQTMTVAFSQELLAPPDANTSAGAWSQRFADGTTVLTDTEFGSWGSGYVEMVSGGTVQQTGHGYITGNSAHFANSTQTGEWYLVVVDANHYTLGVEIANSGGYTPDAGDAVFIDLQTSQCAFNPSTVTAYLAYCYVQASSILNGAGLTPWLQFGEVGHWFFSETMSLGIAAFADSGGLIEVETASAHGFSTGWTSILAGTGLIDGTQSISVIDATHFTVDGSTWPGGSPAAAGTVSGGGMAYYDANQAAAALTALSRALWSFYTQDDDPTINSSADADFLAGRIYSHVSTIISAVLAAVSGAQFEVLWPFDVNFSGCYYTDDLPFPQGGRLNYAVNLPSQWHAKSGSGLNRFKAEGLSWGSEYFNFDNALATMRFAFTVLSWAKNDVRYLIAWDNQGCPWDREWWATLLLALPGVNLWAIDHAVLFSWRTQPLPIEPPSVTR